MLKSLEWFLKDEYQATKKLLEEKPSWLKSPEDAVRDSIERCLGASMFATITPITVDYREVDKLYMEYRKKLLSLLEGGAS